MKKLFGLLLVCGILLTLVIIGCKNEDKPPVVTPPSIKTINYTIEKTYPHDTSFYTQGLIIYKGELYEGTGLPGRSRLMKVDLATGKVLQIKPLDAKYFGEGITIINDTLYQLTWKDRVVFMYSLKDFKLLKEFPLATDGWGITNNGKELIVSDGSSNITYFEPGTFKEIRKISVTHNDGFINNVNEMEFIDGYIYANRYQTDEILKIDPVTGIVVAKIDFTRDADTVRKKYPFVDYFNGIAYDASTKKVYVTGKLWPELYEIRLAQ